MDTLSMAESAEQMNKFLRNELAAVETYRKATESLSDVKPQVKDALQSHQRRVQALRDHLREMNVTPAEDSGAWGAFANLAQRVADAAGDRAAISLLEEGEDRGLKDYNNHAQSLAACCAKLVEDTLLPEHRRTHRMLSDLKNDLH